MEYLRLCLKIQDPYHARSRLRKQSSGLTLSTELTPKEKVQLKPREDILTSPIEVNRQSTDVADEEQLFSSYQTKKKNRNKNFLQEKHPANNVL